MHRALLPISLSERKKVELLYTAGIRSLHNTLVSMLIQDSPVIMRNFDVLKHLKLVKSAVSRTVFVSKQRELKNLLGYFMKTLGGLLREEFKDMVVDLVHEGVLQAIDEQECYVSVCEEKSAIWTPVWRHEVYRRVMALILVKYRAV